MVRFTELQTETTIKKILLPSWVVKGKIAFPGCSHFMAKFVDFCPSYRNPKKNTNIASSGRTRYLRLAAFLVFFRGARVPLLPFLTRLFIPAAGIKRSPRRSLSMIARVRKLTTLLRSPGSTFPRTFATLKALLVIPASSAMSFIV